MFFSQFTAVFLCCHLLYFYFAKNRVDQYTGFALQNGSIQSFTFDPTGSFRYWRIFMIDNYLGGYEFGTSEVEMMEKTSSAPTLTGTSGIAQAALSWTEVAGASGYNVYWSTTSGSGYQSISEAIYGTSVIDGGLTNGTTYYYVVTAVVDGIESGNSNEVSVTPSADPDPDPSGNGTLIIRVENGSDFEYNLTMSEIEDFIDWYNNRSTGGNVYIIEKPAAGAYTSIKDYFIFDKIVWWEVNEY